MSSLHYPFPFPSIMLLTETCSKMGIKTHSRREFQNQFDLMRRVGGHTHVCIIQIYSIHNLI